MKPALPESAIDPSILWEELARDGDRIVLLVADGLGGLPDPATGRSELEVARTPHLDELAARSACGLIEPVAAGVTPGSGPGHLALFGYHPLRHRVGRGVLSALGIGFDLREGDVAARVNFATVDDEGLVRDRRAGRIDTEECRTLCERILEHVDLGRDVDWFLEPVRDHRAVLVLRGSGLSGALQDTDPHRTGVPARPVETTDTDENTDTNGTTDADDAAAAHTADLVRTFVEGCRELLAEEPHADDEPHANAVLLRGFDIHTPLPGLEARFGLRGVCLAEYPMYRGLSRLLGLEVAPPPKSAKAAFGEQLQSCWREDHDLFFLHYKPTDSRGEDGQFDDKVAALEELDAMLPHVLAVEPPVLVVTGDHSTPARMAGHGWHPVPLLIRAASARVDRIRSFDELAFAGGSLGLRPALDVMGLALAHAGRLRKFGA